MQKIKGIVEFITEDDTHCSRNCPFLCVSKDRVYYDGDAGNSYIEDEFPYCHFNLGSDFLEWDENDEPLRCEFCIKASKTFLDFSKG